MKLTITAKQLLELCNEEGYPMHKVYDCVEGTWPRKINVVRLTSNNSVWFLEEQFEVTMELDETLVVMIFKEISDLSEVLTD